MFYEKDSVAFAFVVFTFVVFAFVVFGIRKKRSIHETGQIL